MPRREKGHELTNKELTDSICKSNLNMMEQFYKYICSSGYSNGTVSQYYSDIRIFFVWNYKCNKNKLYKNITANQFKKFYYWMVEENGCNQKRISRIGSVLKHFDSFAENIYE